MGEERERKLLTVASAQQGLVTQAQFQEIGFASSTITWRARAGRWMKVLPGVYALQGSQKGWLRDLGAAVLWAGDDAAASYEAAAKLLRFDGIGREVVEISVPKARNPRHEGITVHRVGSLIRADVLTTRFPRRTNIGRTLVDLTPHVTKTRLERALESAWRQYKDALVWTWQAVHRMPRSHHVALRPLIDLLDTRLLEPTDSELEAMMLPFIGEGGVPEPVLHFRVQGCRWYDPELDFAWPLHRVGLQTHGFRFHGRYRNWTSDIRIRRYLEDSGWQIVEASREDVVERPLEVIDSIRTRLNRSYSVTRAGV